MAAAQAPTLALPLAGGGNADSNAAIGARSLRAQRNICYHPAMGQGEGAPRLWIKIYFGDRGQIGPGKIRLLQGIAEHRSISAAARAMGMSYRRAWVLVDQMNQTFGAPVAATHTGGSGRGGAELTPLGRKIVSQYQDLMELAEAGTADKLGALAALIRPED